MKATVSLAAVAAMSALVTLPAAAADAPKAPYKAPRAADGHADLQGPWTNSTLTRLEREAKFGTRKAYTKEEAAAIEKTTDERNERLRAPTDQKVIEGWASRKGPDTADECQSGTTGAGCGYNASWTDPGDRLMRVNGEPRTSLITFPENGRVPAMLPGKGGARRFAPVEDEGEAGDAGPQTARARPPAAAGARPAGRPSQNDNPEGRSLGERCIMSFGQSSGPVMGSQLYNNNYQFVQTKDHVAIWVEMVHDVRVIRIGGEHRKDGVRPWMGDSVGHWEGDTLVVDTIGYHPSQTFRGADENLRVIEKFTRVADDRLLYQFRVEDPTVWTQPWGGEYEFARGQGVYEYACAEGNYGLEGILAGARDEERQAAANSGPRADAR